MARAADPFAPMDRRWIDAASRPLRGLIGTLFVVYSSYATVFLAAQDVLPVFGTRSTLGVIEDRYWVGVLFAAAFFIGESLSAERAPRVYRALLVPDTIYTARQMYPGAKALYDVLMHDFGSSVFVLALSIGLVWLAVYAAGWRFVFWGGLSSGAGLVVVGALMVAPAWTTTVTAILIVAFFGYVVARFGEVLLFGKRRAVKALAT